MIPISVDKVLPEPDTYVLAYFPNVPWRSGTSTKHKWVVVKLVIGLSLADRAKLPDNNDRKHTYRSEDEYGNNIVPYNWRAFGPDSFFGQEASHWCHLPTPPIQE